LIDALIREALANILPTSIDFIDRLVENLIFT